MRYYKPFERPKNDEFIQECDNPLVEQFKEIPPFTQDPVSGEILNDTPFTKLVKVEPMNIQEYIDSFDDKDIYSMIKNLINDPLGVSRAKLNESMVADTTIYPKNIHEAQSIINNGVAAKDSLDPRIVEAINDDDKLKSVIMEILKAKDASIGKEPDSGKENK